MKPLYVDELFNRRVIISELKARLNDDDVIDASGITEVQTETAVFQNWYKNNTYQCVEWVNKLKLLLLLNFF